MTNEEIIRDEANKFTYRRVESLVTQFGGHKDFLEKLKIELYDFYDVESKMIFLDQVILNVNTSKNLHQAKCPVSECDKDKAYDKILFFVQQEVNELPKFVRESISSSNNERTTVFISYSHRDIDFLNDLKRHFKPLNNIVDFWDDSKIQVGEKWKQKIEEGINKAKIAILLISADFFNSDFIASNELPRLLSAAESDGATIISVILKPCLFEEFPSLNKFQAINSPLKPISSLDETEKELMWVEIVRQVKSIISKSSLAETE